MDPLTHRSLIAVQINTRRETKIEWPIDEQVTFQGVRDKVSEIEGIPTEDIAEIDIKCKADDKTMFYQLKFPEANNEEMIEQEDLEDAEAFKKVRNFFPFSGDNTPGWAIKLLYNRYTLNKVPRVIKNFNSKAFTSSKVHSFVIDDLDLEPMSENEYKS